MGRIQSSVGLITGLPIADTVDQLISVAARPRDLLLSRTKALQNQQVAIGELTALAIAIQLASDKFKVSGVFNQTKATSSNSEALSAKVTGNPAVGNYQFTPVRSAQNHQLLSSGVASLDQALGAGTFSFRFGGAVDDSIELAQLNSGQGIERGKIRITDRSGASAVVDLRFAQTIDDVVNQINNTDAINVSATADGDRIRLSDLTGQAVSNLKVQEIGTTATAASLGLANIDVAASQVVGQDVLALYDGLRLDRLNDGNGVSLSSDLPDLDIALRDGTSLQIDFRAGSNNEQTLGDVLQTLNAADPTRLRAEISGDGDRILLTDLSTDNGGTFQVSSAVGTTVAEDLGLTASANGDQILSRRLQSGLKTPLLSSLGGGQGLGTLGLVNLQDRSGATAQVDLAGSETLQDVLDRINASGLALDAQVNSARNGIQIRDTSGQTAANLVVQNADATNSADRLKLAVDDSVNQVNSGSLDLQVFNENLLLADLNAGEGVQLSSFLITDSAGQQSAINLKQLNAKTVGDVLDAINGLSIGVTAQINDTGDGIALIDTAGGSGTLSVVESGSGTAAKDLRILGTAQTVDVNGVPTQVIDGTTTVKITLDADDTLQDLREKIEALENSGVSVSIFNDNFSDNPFRLSLVSTVPGREGQLVVDSSQFGLDFDEIAAAQDALLLYGAGSSSSAGVLVASSSNSFENLIDGVTLSLGQATGTPVNIRIDSSDAKLVSNAKLFVESFNKLQTKINDLTFFNEADSSTGILFGSNETLRLESSLGDLVTGRFLGEIGSLEELGISIGEDGLLDLDEARLQQKFSQDPEAVEAFFTDETNGFVARFNSVIDQLAGENNSLLITSNDSLQRKIDLNNERIAFMNDRLEVQRESLLRMFYATEEAIARVQSNLSVIQGLQALPPLTSTRS